MQGGIYGISNDLRFVRTQVVIADPPATRSGTAVSSDSENITYAHSLETNRKVVHTSAGVQHAVTNLPSGLGALFDHTMWMKTKLHGYVSRSTAPI